MKSLLDLDAIDIAPAFGTVGLAPTGRFFASTLVALAATVGVATAHASCADPRTPHVAQARMALAAPVDASTLHDGPASEAIVGTWFVTYTAAGAPGGQAYIQWHSDGTEWENIDNPIESGNICMGSWKRVDARHVSRNHYGWVYTGGILSGHFNETEIAEVGRNGTYTGITDFKLYDLDGNLQVEFPGTSSAVRIAP